VSITEYNTSKKWNSYEAAGLRINAATGLILYFFASFIWKNCQSLVAKFIFALAVVVTSPSS
jgi:hypothetical protein